MKKRQVQLFLFFLMLAFAGQLKAQDRGVTENYKAKVAQSFDNWVQRTGSPFDLLADDVVWTITGSSAQAKTYTSKQQLISEVLDPLNARLSKRITPEVKGIYADGDMVIVLWRSKAETNAGEPYDGDYAWFMHFENDKVTQVTAFLDNQKFAEAMALSEHK